MNWHKLTIRELTEEEEDYYDYDFMWEGDTPELFEKVLVTQWKDKNEIYLDEWTEFDDGAGFEGTDVDYREVVYWCKIPEFDFKEK